MFNNILTPSKVPAYFHGYWPENAALIMSISPSSILLEKVNFAYIVAGLEAIDPNAIEITLNNSWLTKSVEHLFIKLNSEKLPEIQEYLNQQKERWENYPVLDENEFSQKEYNAVAEYWEACSESDKLELIRKHYPSMDLYNLPERFLEDLPNIDSAGFIFLHIAEDL